MGRSVFLHHTLHNPASLVRAKGEEIRVLDPSLMHRAMENGVRIVPFQKDVVLDGDDTGVGQFDRIVGVLLQILHVYADHEPPYPKPHVFFVHEHVKRDGLQRLRENYTSA